jgi:hypothetical protein
VFAGLYHLAPKVLNAVKILKPETIIRWHRAGFRAWWRWKSRPRGGRPRTPDEIRQLIDLTRGRRAGGTFSKEKGRCRRISSNRGQLVIARNKLSICDAVRPSGAAHRCISADPRL